VIKLLRARGG